MRADELADLRNTRLSGKSGVSPEDQRSAAQRDRDRILYSTAFRRLAEITQVVRASEGHHFHNRLTHVLKVSQIGRRIAERLSKQNVQDKLNQLGGLDPDVVEAAGLAHDLGHPPFGHVAEKKLQDICSDLSTEAFQGNAQSFRIVTNLAVRSPEEQGLDLTLPTLNAILKYPWLKKDEGPYAEKWGAYTSEAAAYEKARKAAPFRESKTLEAELMDWADDVAYAVYDMDDFYRAGLIPLDRLIENNDPKSVRRKGKNTLESFLESVSRRWKAKGRPLDHWEDYRTQFRSLLRVFGSLDALRDPYSGTQAQRGALRHITSLLVERYANSVELAEPQVFAPVSGYAFFNTPIEVPNEGPTPVKFDDGLRIEVTMLKELTWTYVIENPSLAAQQEGQKLIVETLYNRFTEAAINGKWNIFPSSVRTDILGAMTHLRNEPANRARVVIDLISSMTEVQAIEMYQRLTGYSAASVLQRILG